MKKKLLVFLSIAIVGTAAYVYSSYRADRDFAIKGRKTHMDSLRTIQASLLSTAPPVTDSLLEEDYPEPPTDIWHVRDVGLMPDSLEPMSFSEAAVEISYEDGEYSYVQYKEVGTEWVIDSAATRTAIIENAFVDSTVMKVLLYHLVQHVDADAFSRCPSGYYAFLLDTMDQGWKYGSVYYGYDCSDTSLCDFRINYPKRLVQMRDAGRGSYLSLRTYEMLKFAPNVAEAIDRKKGF